ncbi:MAG: hypothetical protein U0264_01500 [Candidatus Kapaibacterium sp.]
MKILSSIAMLLGAFFYVLIPANAQQLQADILNQLKSSTLQLTNSNQSKEFWLAVPLNESKAQPTLNLEFYVTSQYNSYVTIEVPGSGFIMTKKIKALEVAVFSTKTGTANFDWEIESSQVPDNKGIHIFGDKPLSVYVFNGKEVTSDGYMAMPVNSWGTEYVHCAYYDFNEYRPLGAGFVVIAAHDSTKVTIRLKGKGKGFAKTRSGSSIGDTFEVMLNQGQVYNVVGDATTISTFDLTGSIIQADKPVGVISYHERTLLPQNSQNGRDHLVEMLRPTSAWGKKHITLEFIRDNKGDFFRIVACRDNTKWSLKYYDKIAGTLLGQRSGILNRGEFFEDYNTWEGKSAIAGIRGVSVWESDKPTMVMQYQYSANWDRGDKFDPDMVLVTPVEQFMNSTLFQAPSNPTFVDNWYNYIVEGDSTDTNNVKLKTLVIDGDSVYKTYPQLFLNRVTGTNYYWGYKFMSPGPHIVTCANKFGGYVYGFGSFMGYSWPAGSGTRSLDQLDTLPPVLTYTYKCGDYNYKATEIRKFGVPPDTVQIDQGIYDIALIDSLSYNYQLQLVTSPSIVPLPKVTEFEFNILVKDKTKDALAVVQVMDRAGNYVMDTVRYIVERPGMSESLIRLLDTRVGAVRQKQVSILNPSTTQKLVIKSISLLRKKEYRITDGTNFPEIEIAPSGSHTITLEYTPIREGLRADDDGQLDIDSILVTTTCATFSFPVKGRGVVPCADVELLWRAPVTVIGDTARKEQFGNGLSIRNSGTDTMTVSSISGVRPPFFVSNPKPAFPFKVPPGKEVLFTSVSFVPKNTAIDTVKVQFVTDGNGATCNEISYWIGRGVPVSVDEHAMSDNWELSVTGHAITARSGVSTGFPAHASLLLYNTIGQVVAQSQSMMSQNEISLSTEHLSVGIYSAVLTAGSHSVHTIVFIP